MAINITEGESVVVIEKDKDARKDYSFQLVDIIPPGDTLASVTWTAPTGATFDGNSFSGTEVVVWLSGGTPGAWFSFKARWVSNLGASDDFVIRMFVKEDAEAAVDLGSALFPNKFTAVAQLRRDSLMLAAQNHFSGVALDSAYLWDKLRAAEAETSRTLRVKFQPTQFFPTTPTQDEITALNGMPWEEDNGYDYDPAMYTGDKWGFFSTHSSPIVSVDKLTFAYPANGGPSFEIPTDWLQVEKKYGHVRIVPITISAAAMLTPFIMQVLGIGRIIPNMVRITYKAGLQNAAANYPDLVDVVKKIAVLKIIEDGFLPQSGSISADGLSQSMSIDMSKYQDTIDVILTGRKGSNGGLRAAIHGISMAVMG